MSATDQSENSIDHQKPRVMYVDDDPDDQEVFIQALLEVNSALNYIIAFDGVDALLKLAKEPKPICIYIDINMPKMNGVELLRRLRAHETYKDIPTFILTTSISPFDEEEVIKIGGAPFLRKPNTFEAYKALLKKCLDSHDGI
jgi:CheY-like chemotaxis protein